MTHDKGLDDLLAASALLARSGVQHQLLVVGGHDEPDSLQYVRRLNDADITALLA